MRSTTVTFTCDRCGKAIERDADVRIAEEKLPDGWGRMRLDSTLHEPLESFEICRECRREIVRSMGLPPAVADAGQ
jgi:hypothetical protein